MPNFLPNATALIVYGLCLKCKRKFGTVVHLYCRFYKIQNIFLFLFKRGSFYRLSACNYYSYFLLS